MQKTVGIVVQETPRLLASECEYFHQSWQAYISVP